MDVTAAVIAGIVGTAAMTLLVYIAPALGMPKVDMIGMLSAMSVEKSPRRICLVLSSTS